MKTIIKNQNALYVKMIVNPNLEKLYKKSLPIIDMKSDLTMEKSD